MNNKGQSIFEFLFFVPFLVILFVSLVKIQGALNASINQQKSARGYFFNLTRHNSMLPDRNELDSLMNGQDINSFGLTLLGWRSYSQGGIDGDTGQNPVSSCFNLAGVSTEDDVDDKCEESIPNGKTQVKNIRVYTAYGVCSANYTKAGENIIYTPGLASQSGACQNQ